jgi:peptide/nickel transport system permease protein
MGRYILRRILLAIPTLIGVSLITFMLVRFSGDPARFVLGEQATEEAVASFNARHGLDRPMLVQFMDYNWRALQGDLGDSVRYNEPVTSMLGERIGATLELGASAFVLSIIVGITAGVISALNVGKAPDRITRAFALLLQSIPGFYLGILLIILVSVNWGLLPTGGRGSFQHLILPTVTLSTVFIATIVRFTRSSMLDVLTQDFVRTARAKGLAERAVVIRHVLRNALVPLITVLALQVAVIFSGAVVTETIFSWPGVGRLVVGAIQTRDYPVVQGTVLVLTSCVVLLNIVVDIAYGAIDPRIKIS